MRKILERRRLLLLTSGAGLLAAGALVAVLLTGGSAPSASAHGGDTASAHLCVHKITGGVRIVSPTTNCLAWETALDLDLPDDNGGGSAVLTGNGKTKKTETKYLAISGDKEEDTSAKANTPLPRDGTLGNLHVLLTDKDPGTDPDSYTFTVMINDLASAITCTITADAKACSDTSNTESVSAGDKVSLRATPGNTPADDVDVRFSLTLD